MNTKAFLFFLTIICIGCSKKEPHETILCGRILNPIDNFVVLYFNDQVVDSATIDTKNNFCFRLSNLKQNGLYYFKTSDNFQYIYLEKGDSLLFSANTYNFHKSVTYSGTNASINNFINEMKLKVEQNENLYQKWYRLSPDKFITKVDSIYLGYQHIYNDFLKKNKKLSLQAQKIAWASFFFDAHKPYELYKLENERIFQKKIILPEYFYNFRKKLNYNDLEISYFNPYYQYLIEYVNNIAYQKSVIANIPSTHREARLLNFQLNKLQTIDSVFKHNAIKDNMLRNASFSYLLNPRDEMYNRIYVEELSPRIEHNSHKREIKQLYQTILDFEKNKPFPNFQVVDINNDTIYIKNLIKPSVYNVFYFWSIENEYAKYLHYRIQQLKEISPDVNFVGIEIGGNYQKWLYEVADSDLIGTEQYYIDSYRKDSDRHLFSFNVNKAIVVNTNGVIEDTFAEVFSPKMEEILVLRNHNK